MNSEDKIHLLENPIVKMQSGSFVYGTNIETSDQDWKGIWVQSPQSIYWNGWIPQLKVSKDERWYEIREWFNLIKSSDPTCLEMLWTLPKWWDSNHPLWETIYNKKEIFLSKACKKRFAGYGISQVKKAKGTDKKMNWAKHRVTQKTPLDFCWVLDNWKSISFKKWLEKNPHIILDNIGLSKVNHQKDTYLVYYNSNKIYRGVLTPGSSQLKTSSILKEEIPLVSLYYNEDGYSTHCKDWKEYSQYLKERNTDRYVEIEGHSQQIDGKNMLHCRRLIETAMEIPITHSINLERPNAPYLISIRKGKLDLDTLLNQSLADLKKLDAVYDNSDLQDVPDIEQIDLLLKTILQHYEK